MVTGICNSTCLSPGDQFSVRKRPVFPLFSEHMANQDNALTKVSYL